VTEYLPGQLQLPDTAEDKAGQVKRLAGKPLRPTKEQKPCDLGLFSDDARQVDLEDYLKPPQTDEP
jgi:hypothetical protein